MDKKNSDPRTNQGIDQIKGDTENDIERLSANAPGLSRYGNVAGVNNPGTSLPADVPGVNQFEVGVNQQGTTGVNTNSSEDSGQEQI
jgi:hypothetical protein